ncbi:hypothetical protein CDV31_004281 [Fusarium ambrosium]|uniref:Uncharacterized protein n=1 Tax=Fusarium ambrosium TaxID=131363 RepID=A0A428URP4_9HYPO|nr:hypothetical protein CDV31_004281 [Fusarium ambrosium]
MVSGVVVIQALAKLGLSRNLAGLDSAVRHVVPLEGHFSRSNFILNSRTKDFTTSETIKHEKVITIIKAIYADP